MPINDAKLINKVEAVKNIPIQNSVTPAPAVTNAPQAEKPTPQTVVNESAKGKYHVVCGCFKIRENADKLAERLIKQGYPAQVSNLGKHFFRVSIQSFKSRKEAEMALSQLAKTEPQTGYWLMADKK